MKNKQLLIDLRDFLFEFPEDRKFNISNWHDSNIIQNESESVKCGTACCAVGWAIICLDSWKDNGFFNTACGFDHKKIYQRIDASRYIEEFRILQGVFDLSESDIDSMFVGDNYLNSVFYNVEIEEDITPMMVAEQIDRVLENFL